MEAENQKKSRCTIESDLELLKLYQDGNQEALNDLVSIHLGLIYLWVGKVVRRTRWVSREDLRQQGCVGFIEAVKKFDTSENEDFHSKARESARESVKASLFRSSSSKVSFVKRHQYRNCRKVAKAYDELINDLDRRPTHEELAERTKLTERQVNNAMEVIAALPFLFQSEEKYEPVEVEDLHQFEDPYQKQQIKDALKQLTRYEALVIIRYHFYGQTDSEIAKDLRRSTAAIKMARHRAEQKLRAIIFPEEFDKDGI
jgi:RNA polymerase sporulation-specific sigma factor